MVRGLVLPSGIFFPALESRLSFIHFNSKSSYVYIFSFFCRLYLNLQKQFVGEFQYVFHKYALLLVVFLAWVDCLSWWRELALCLCSFQILVLLMHMDLLETDFGALTLIHLLFQQIPPIRFLLIWSSSLLKKILRPGLTGKILGRNCWIIRVSGENSN